MLASQHVLPACALEDPLEVPQELRDSFRAEAHGRPPRLVLAEDEILGPDRHVVIAREVTKLHEEFLRSRAADVLEILQSRDAVKGEITLLIGKSEEEKAGVETAALARPSIRQRVDQIITEENVDEKAALKKVAKERGISKSDAYRELQRTK